MSPFDRLTHELSKLPGIGQKSAMRLALFILRQGPEYAKTLSDSLIELIAKITFCSHCFHFTDRDPCATCSDPKRDSRMICVVEDSADLMALEKTHVYRGRYHVLQGALSPLDGIGPDQLRCRELIERLKKEEVREIILATNPNVTGDATALYLARLLKPFVPRLTRLSSGIPVGGQINYIDSLTLSKALETRREY